MYAQASKKTLRNTSRYCICNASRFPTNLDTLCFEIRPKYLTPTNTNIKTEKGLQLPYRYHRNHRKKMLTTTCTILVLIIRFTLIIRNQHPPQYYRPTECPTRSLLNLRPANTKPQASDKDYQPLLSSIYQAYQVIHGASSFTSTTLLSTSHKMAAASSGHNLRGRGSSKKTSNAAADDLMKQVGGAGKEGPQREEEEVAEG